MIQDFKDQLSFVFSNGGIITVIANTIVQLKQIEFYFREKIKLCETKVDFRMYLNEIDEFCKHGEYSPEQGAWNDSLEWIQIKLFKLYLIKFTLTPREEFTHYVFRTLKPFFKNKLCQNYLHRYILKDGKVGINNLNLDALSYLRKQIKKKDEIDYKVFLFFFKDKYPVSEIAINHVDLFIKILKRNLPKFKSKYRIPLITHYILEYKDEDHWAPEHDSYEDNKHFYYLFLRSKLVECLRESENQLREKLGYKRIGEGYVMEHTLYIELTKVIDPTKIRRRYRPKWLGGLELDFFFEIENRKMAIEYQGAQHVRAVKNFGGKTAFKKQISRDRRKLKLCHENNVKLHYCYFDDSIRDFVCKISEKL